MRGDMRKPQKGTFFVPKLARYVTERADRMRFEALCSAVNERLVPNLNKSRWLHLHEVTAKDINTRLELSLRMNVNRKRVHRTLALFDCAFANDNCAECRNNFNCLLFSNSKVVFQWVFQSTRAEYWSIRLLISVTVKSFDPRTICSHLQTHIFARTHRYKQKRKKNCIFLNVRFSWILCTKHKWNEKPISTPSDKIIIMYWCI